MNYENYHIFMTNLSLTTITGYWQDKSLELLAIGKTCATYFYPSP